MRGKRKQEPKAKHVILSLAMALSFNSHFSSCRSFITMHIPKVKAMVVHRTTVSCQKIVYNIVVVSISMLGTLLYM